MDDKYAYLFSVEVVNNLVLEGLPFREAYKKVGLDIEAGKFETNRKVNHTHEGSIGNLNLNEVKTMMGELQSQFKFDKIEQAVQDLVS